MEELAKRMMELAQKVGPDAMAAARNATSVEAYSSMVAAVLWLGFSAIVFYAGFKLWHYKVIDNYNAGPAAFFAGMMMLIAIGIVFGSIWTFVDPWTWTAIKNPDLYLAKKILKL